MSQIGSDPFFRAASRDGVLHRWYAQSLCQSILFFFDARDNHKMSARGRAMAIFLTKRAVAIKFHLIMPYDKWWCECIFFTLVETSSSSTFSILVPRYEEEKGGTWIIEIIHGWSYFKEENVLLCHLSQARKPCVVYTVHCTIHGLAHMTKSRWFFMQWMFV